MPHLQKIKKKNIKSIKKMPWLISIQYFKSCYSHNKGKIMQQELRRQIKLYLYSRKHPPISCRMYCASYSKHPLI